MRVLLVNPPPVGVPVVLDAVICRCAGIERKAGELLPPIGLAYIAGVLREAGHSVRMVDCAASGISSVECHRLVAGFSPGLLVTVAYESNLSGCLSLLKAAKSAGALTALAGSYPTLNDVRLLSSPEVDFIVRGEPEATFLELSSCLCSGRPLSGVQGLSYRSGGKIRRNKDRPLLKALDALPFPARDLLPNDRYRLAYSERPLQTVILGSRGCPFKCVFCTSNVYYGTSFRARSAVNVVDEIEQVVDNFDIRDFSFQDDTFTLDKRQVLAICDELKARRLDVSWQCTSRVDTVDPAMLARMRSAGCYLIKFGIESGDEAVLGLLRKGISLQQAREAVSAAKKAGIKTGASFIIGTPWDTPQTTRKTLSFAKGLDLDYASFNVFRPFDGPRASAFRDVPYRLTWRQVQMYLLQAYAGFYLRPRQLRKYLSDPLRSASGGLNILRFLLHKLSY